MTMPDDNRYEAALTTALAIIHELSTRPGMSRPQMLSTITFRILRAMHRIEDHPRKRRQCVEPSVN
jgi:hypothetical protein